MKIMGWIAQVDTSGVAGMDAQSMPSKSQIVYEFARAGMIEGWWLWALVVATIVLALVLGTIHYRRDVSELPRPVRWTLLGLRLTVVLALVFFFFDLQRRTERLITRPSEVVVLADNSQSMSLPVDGAVGSISRVEFAQQLLGDAKLSERLSDVHRVHVYRFDSSNEPTLMESIDSPDVEELDSKENETSVGIEANALEPARIAEPVRIAQFGAFAVAIGLAVGLIALLIGAFGRGGLVGWWLWTSASSLVLGGLCLGGAYAVHTEHSIRSILGFTAPTQTPAVINEPTSQETEEVIRPPVPWTEQLAATGTESRIGDALQSVLGDHEPSTLAGVVLVTDGQSNGGQGLGNALTLARRNEVSLYPVGLGSSAPPVNVRVVSLDVPKRIYPGDKFSVSAVLQASGPEAMEVDVQLLDGLDSTDGKTADGSGQTTLPTNVVDVQSVRLASDGTLMGVRFELEPESVGRRRIAVRVVAPEQDTNDRDDIRDARYEVVSRKLKVLAIAGGPTREYRFVRNLLYRDESVELDVFLQTGQVGMSQDADRLRSGFPTEPEDMFEYDAMLFFDPDWNSISTESLDLLERWVTQQAGGIVLIGGPVYHPRWFRKQTDPRVSKVRAFFPVQLATRGPLLGGGRQGGENPWPFQFTAEATRAEFLRISDEVEENQAVWDEFEGVYDFLGVKGAKPGAKVYAYYSDPTTKISDELPIYLASQFFGAGRTYFQSSGEMWRLRGLSDAYFDRYYTQLVRWVSEGRLLRDSDRGILLVDNSRAMVGDTIMIRAVLSDDQFEPLQVPSVPVQILLPGGRVSEMKLLPLDGEPRPGTYGGRLTVREAGDHEIRLTLGNALAEEILQQSVQVRLPTVELERPQRNDESLRQLADMTSGKYLALSETENPGSVAEQLREWIQPQPQRSVLPGTPDLAFTQRRNVVLMWLIATMLTFEWVTRRLHRLA